VTGVLDAADSVTVKARSVVPLLSWITEASVTDSVGRTGGGVVDELSSTRLLAVVLPLPVAA
jgi:hypothetical protein